MTELAVKPTDVFFRFEQAATQLIRSRYYDGHHGKYKIIPNIIAIDINSDDAKIMTEKQLGKVVTGKIATGSPGYESRKP